MKLLTTEKERKIKMEQLRPVSKAGEDPVPDHRYDRCLPDPAYHSSAGWYADVR